MAKQTLKKNLIWLAAVLIMAGLVVSVAAAYTPKPVVDDPVVRMPGTQPGQASLEAPTRCLNCHEGYDSAVEPGFNWKGSMMAQAARDPLFWATMTVAAQDSIFALGNPNATDLCERCHFPQGWLEGRSDPTNASLMTGADYDGVQCDFCHQMVDPFFEATHAGTREPGHDWDETNKSKTPSAAAVEETYAKDAAIAQSILIFNGSAFFTNNEPPAGYTESGSGQYFINPSGEKRASFADATARHQMLYSRYHKSKYFCETCHDVSNPALANVGQDGTSPLTSELQSAFKYFHVERTFSEFMLSAYSQEGGAQTNAEFQAQGAPNITVAASCQDCHMRDVTGQAANKRDAVLRPDQSIEHPNSGVPLHDMTGGNVWISTILASAVVGSPNFDQTNHDLLNAGPAELTLDLTQGEGLNAAALLAGADRARQQLDLAATIKDVSYEGGALSFTIQNNTGHKLISGFPEGRRMFVNIKLYDSSGLIYEVNPYDYDAGTLKGMPDTQLSNNEVYVDELVYEMHPSSTLTGPAGEGEDHTFHFVLGNGRSKDNRIPPKGFDIDGALERLSVPVYNGIEDAGYFTAAEYAGGYDDVSLNVPAGATAVEINLFYQSTSREYVQFLQNEINGTAGTLPAGAYVIGSDSFFTNLRGWGDTIWQLWEHNKNLDGARPYLMAQATTGAPPATCTPPAPPTNLAATPGNAQVSLTWDSVSAANGYKLYLDQAGKAQLVADTGAATSYIDTSVTNGKEYCYKVTAYATSGTTTCESDYSAPLVCATPQNQGQTGDSVGVNSLQSGIITGKGANKTFSASDVIARGETVVIRALVLDASGAPVPNATVAITIGGPEAVTLNSSPSDTAGYADASWQTQAPNRKGSGGTTPGAYTATVSGVTASGYIWDSFTTAVSFTLE
ncbi:MAG: multiheme c-type cytochrome [Candidatus Promineifilaceae bacterium]